MNDLTDMMSNIELNKPDNILMNIIDYDFNKLSELYINKDTNINIEPEPHHEYYLTYENCLIIYNYLNNNYNGYNILKHKLQNNLNVKRFNIVLNDYDIQTYVDYYLEKLIIL